MTDRAHNIAIAPKHFRRHVLYLVWMLDAGELLSRSWRRVTHQLDRQVVRRAELAMPPADVVAVVADALPGRWLGLGLDSPRMRAADI